MSPDRCGLSQDRPDLVVVSRPPSHARRRRRRPQSRLAGLLRLVVFLFLIFIAVWAGVRVANASGDSRVFDGRRYEVRAGDTLWSIVASEYGDRIDVRQAVYDIQRRNDLQDGLIRPGQQIVLPYEGQGAQEPAP